MCQLLVCKYAECLKVLQSVLGIPSISEASRCLADSLNLNYHEILGKRTDGDECIVNSHDVSAL